MADDAQILHRGYRTYDGPRTGVIGALRTVAFQGVRHVLGLGRPAKAKILPIATAAIAFVPAVVYVGLAVLLGDAVQLLEEGEVVPTYSDYYGVILLALVMFAAFVAPRSSDRRSPQRAVGVVFVNTSDPHDLSRSQISRHLGRDEHCHRWPADGLPDRLHLRRRWP